MKPSWTYRTRFDMTICEHDSQISVVLSCFGSGTFDLVRSVSPIVILRIFQLNQYWMKSISIFNFRSKPVLQFSLVINCKWKSFLCQYPHYVIKNLGWISKSELESCYEMKSFPDYRYYFFAAWIVACLNNLYKCAIITLQAFILFLLFSANLDVSQRVEIVVPQKHVTVSSIKQFLTLMVV